MRANTVKLDEAIWKELPDELLEHVLSFLPFPNLFRCRTICKQWRDITQSPHLRLTRSLNQLSWPSFCPLRYYNEASEGGEFRWSGYSAVTNKWQRMPPLSLPCLAGMKVWAGASGLLCFYNRENTDRLVVCNPVTKQWRELPPMNHKWRWPCVTHMIADEETNSYIIVMAGTEAYPSSGGYGRSRITEVYNSSSDKWEAGGSLPLGFYLETQDAAYESGLLYCTAQVFSQQQQQPQQQHSETLSSSSTDVMVAYDVCKGVWKVVSKALPDSSSCQTPLVCGGGRGIAVAVAPVDADGPAGQIFVLDAASRWQLVASMPEAMHRDIGFWGACFSSSVGDEIFVMSDTGELVVAYNLATNSWRKVPRANKKHPAAVMSSRFLAPISFRPDVTSTP